MRLPRIKKKVMAVGVAGGLAIGAGGIAAAFLTGTGAGTGTAHVASAVSVTVNGHINGTFLIGTTRHVTLTLTNPDGPTSLGIASVAVTQPAGCPTGSFTVAPASTPIGTVPGGFSVVTTNTRRPTITFNNLPVTQNACTGVLHFRVSTS